MKGALFLPKLPVEAGLISSVAHRADWLRFNQDSILVTVDEDIAHVDEVP